MPVFKFNDEFYEKSFKNETEALLAGIDINIKGWTSQFKELHDLKEEGVRQIEDAFEAFKKITNKGLLLIQKFKPVVNKLNPVESANIPIAKKFNPVKSAKTLRKIHLYGLLSSVWL